MALKRAKVAFKPGINKDNTALANEGGFVDAQWVSFERAGPEEPAYPECMRGWEAVTADPITGVARGSVAWADAEGQPQIAWGTASGAAILTGGVMEDITPPLFEGYLKTAFSVTSGSPIVSVVFNVYDPDSNTATISPHALKVGDSVTFSHCDAVGGITVSGTYNVTEIVSQSVFRITHGSNASSTATSGANDFAWLRVAFRTGLVDGTGGLGYGTGAWGVGTYGTASTSDFLPALWHMHSYGTDMVAVPRSGPLFRYQPASSRPELITSTSLVGGTGWTIDTGTGISTATASTASNLSQPIEALHVAGKVYRVTVPITVSAGTIYFGVNAGLTPAVVRLTPDINKTGTYTFRYQSPAVPLDIVFAKSSAFAGTVGPISIKLEGDLFRIDEAPIKAEAGFVDPRGIVVLLGTYEADGDYNPMLVRNSGLQNDREWVPDTGNIAGELVLARGSRLVGGLPTRSQNFVWSDTSLYGLTYVGEAGQAFSANLLASGCGLIAPLAAVEHAGFVFWMSNAGQFFTVSYDFQGAVPRQIECSIQNDIFRNIASGQAEKIWAWVNTERNQIWWFWPDARIGNEINSYATFSISSQTWTCGQIVRTTGVSRGILPAPVLISSDGAGSGKLYYHERGNTADGEALRSYLKTGLFDIGDGDNLAALSRIEIDMLDQTGNLNITVSGADSSRGTVRSTGSMLVTPTTNYLYPRFMARRMQIELEANASPSAWRLGAIHLETGPTGARR